MSEQENAAHQVLDEGAPRSVDGAKQSGDEVLGKGSDGVKRAQRPNGFERDVMSQGRGDAQGADEGVGEEGGVGKREEGVFVRGGASTPIPLLLPFSEEKLDKPPEPVGGGELRRTHQLTRYGGEIKAPMTVQVHADYAQCKRGFSITPADIEVKLFEPETRCTLEVGGQILIAPGGIFPPRFKGTAHPQHLAKLVIGFEPQKQMLPCGVGLKVEECLLSIAIVAIVDNCGDFLFGFGESLRGQSAVYVVGEGSCPSFAAV